MFDSVDILFYVLPYQIHPYQSHKKGTCLSNLPVFSLFPKTWFQLRRDVNFHLLCHVLVCNICKSLKTFKAARTLPAEFGYWLLHFHIHHIHTIIYKVRKKSAPHTLYATLWPCAEWQRPETVPRFLPILWSNLHFWSVLIYGQVGNERRDSASTGISAVLWFICTSC